MTILDEYCFALEAIAAEATNEDYNFVFETVNSLPEEYKEKVMQCISIAVEAGKDVNYG